MPRVIDLNGDGTTTMTDAWLSTALATQPVLNLDALEDEFAVLDALLKARNAAGLTQAQVASRMGVSQPVVARIESSLGSKKHSPSLNTLRRYASACGMKLQIQMVSPS